MSTANMQVFKKLTALIEKGDSKALEKALDEGADPNVTDYGKNTLLHFASNKQNYRKPFVSDPENDPDDEFSREKRIITHLLDRGIPVDARNGYKTTPLMLAVLNMYAGEIVELLVEKGADVNAQDVHGLTALHHVMQEGTQFMAELLLYKGADGNMKNLEGHSPLLVGILNNRIKVVLELLNYRQEKPDWPYTPIDVNVRMLNGNTPLMEAVGRSKDIVEVLLENGADVNAQNAYGDTALILLCKMEDKVKTLQVLIQNKADISIKNNGGLTALSYIIENNYSRYTKVILDSGVDIKDQLKEEQDVKDIKEYIERNNEIHEELREHYSFLTYAQLDAISKYTFHGDGYIRDFLLGKDTLEWYKKKKFNTLFNLQEPIDDITGFQKVVFTYYKDLYGAIETKGFRTVDTPIQVFRGVKTHRLSEDIGKTHYINMFTSTSLSFNVAMEFSGGIFSNKTSIIYEFFLHPLCFYGDITFASRFRSEKEVLLNPYQRICFIKKDASHRLGDVIVYTYAILPSDLEIPTGFDEFVGWKKEIQSKDRGITQGNTGLLVPVAEAQAVAPRMPTPKPIVQEQLPAIENEQVDESEQMPQEEQQAPASNANQQAPASNANQQQNKEENQEVYVPPPPKPKTGTKKKKKTWLDEMLEEEPMSGGRTAAALIPRELHRTRKLEKSIRSRSKTQRSVKSKKTELKLKGKTVRSKTKKAKGMVKLSRKSKSKSAINTFSEEYKIRMTEPLTTGMERPRSVEDTQLIQDLMAFMAKKSPSKSSEK